MARLHTVRCAVAVLILLVGETNLAFGYCDALGEPGRIEYNQLHAALFQNAEVSLVLLEIFAHFLGSDLDLLLELFGIDLYVLDGGLLVFELEFVFDIGLGNYSAFEDHAAQAVQEHLFRCVRFEVRNRHVLLGQELSVGVFPDELAFGEQLGHGFADGFGRFGLGDAHPHPAGLIGERLLVDHLFDDLGDVVLQHFGRQLPVPSGHTNGSLHVAQCDLIAPYIGDHAVVGTASTRAAVTGDQVTHHGNSDQRQYDCEKNTHSLIAAAEQIEHLVKIS